MFIYKQKINFILNFILEILQRYCKIVVLGTLEKVGYAHLKGYYQFAENIRVYM